MHIGVVIPAYNESKRIGSVLEDIFAYKSAHTLSIIVVSDGSKDKTAAIVRKFSETHPSVQLIEHCLNLGKGAAAKTGCDAAYAQGVDVILLMDADGQHRPEDIDRMVEPLLNVKKGLVVGVRSRSGTMPFMMRFGNSMLTSTTRLLFNIRVQDTQSGFRAFHGSVYPKVRWVASNYAMETEMLILASFHGIPVHEVQIATVYHDSYKGTTALDGLRIINVLFQWRLFCDRFAATAQDFELTD